MYSLIRYVLALQAQAPLPFVSPTFSDHMVLQRGVTNTMWGWTTPGAHVSVTVADSYGQTKADKSGKWTVRFRPPRTGGPYRISVDGPQHAVLKDVLVGDVWICSGQSNMEFGLVNIPAADADIASSSDRGLRLYTVPHKIAFSPQDLVYGRWVESNSTNIMSNTQGSWNGFSAVAYYFGKSLRHELNVPIGLLQTCWSGTPAESWTSEEALLPLKDFDEQIKWVHGQLNGKSVPFEIQLDQWYSLNDSGEKSGYTKVDYDDSSWQSATMPKPFEDIGLKSFDGIVWFRKVFDLADVPTGDASIRLGPIDDADTTFINGVRVGAMQNYDQDRVYQVPTGTLHKGRNTIAVRVLDTGYAGGFSDRTVGFGVTLSGGIKINLAGKWRYLVGPEYQKLNPAPRNSLGNPNIATVLSNGMIAPLAPLAVKGAIWYQGESNTGRGDQYRKLLPTMINDWRARFDSDLPFFIVQLANFQTRHDHPVDDDWAELREAQAYTANAVPRTSLVPAIDIGEHDDGHPKNKKEVGRRLALAALHSVYRKPGPYSGPVAVRASKLDGGALAVVFDHADGGLVASGGRLSGFAIAGVDRRFFWADARIISNRVLLTSKDVPNPVYVRYGWDMDPDVTLTNGAGLPAVPFRSDGPVPFNGIKR